MGVPIRGNNGDNILGPRPGPFIEEWCIYGYGGDDFIFGDQLDDELYGGSGGDFLTGNRGSDVLYGGTGSDWMYGGEDDDRLEGGSGNDAVYGDGGNDGLYGGKGNDQLFGGSGQDWMNGGSGNNFLYGGGGNDFINMNGYGATNVVNGGAGRDTFYFTTYYNNQFNYVEDFDSNWDKLKLVDLERRDGSLINNGADADTNGDGRISAADDGWTSWWGGELAFLDANNNWLVINIVDGNSIAVSDVI